MKVFYDPRQSVSDNDSFSPSAGKPAEVVRSWSAIGGIEIESFDPCTLEEITLVHDPKYVADVLAGRIPNGFGNTSEKIATALPWVCGSMKAAALYSLRSGRPAFSPTAGAHHANYAVGAMFCTFNFLVLAAVVAKKNGAQRVGIIDCDNHFGDGTAEIIERLGLDYIQHYSFGAETIQAGPVAQDWLERFPQTLFTFEGCDLLIYNAGVDPHVNDELGGVLTTEQMRLRDHYVFDTARAIRSSICVSLAGGYQRDKAGSIRPVLDLHDNTLRECLEVYSWDVIP